MNRAEGMAQLGADLGLTPPPATLAELVTAAGGTRAAAGLLGVDLTDTSKEGKTRIASAQRTLQRYQRAEAGETGKNVRGQKAEARQALIDKLREAIKPQWQQQQKAEADKQFPFGFHAKVKGNFFVSSDQKGRTVHPVFIPRADMDGIIDKLQDDDLAGAAKDFDTAYGISYNVPSMRWGEDDADADAFDSLTID